VASIFQDILKRGLQQGILPARTQAAREWYRDKARRVADSRRSSERIIEDTPKARKKNNVEIGKMYCYVYDPKWKEKLPYYDTFPCIFMVGPAHGGFYGINIHYLPPSLRAKLMDGLYEITNNRRYDGSTKLKLSYQLLKSTEKLKWFKPCFKHYLNSHVRSVFIEIPSQQWDIAMALPSQKFKKQNQYKVYYDSRQKING